MTESDVDPKEVEKGMEIEKEHTPDKDTAKRITLDHLAEVPDYNTRLLEMEDEAEKESSMSEELKAAWATSFVKKAKDLGADPKELSSKLRKVQDKQSALETAWATGFDKQAQEIDDASGGAISPELLRSLIPLLGAGIGGVGGAVTGGKHKVRNALMGALMGGGLGYGAQQLTEPRAMDKITGALGSAGSAISSGYGSLKNSLGFGNDPAADAGGIG